MSTNILLSGKNCFKVGPLFCFIRIDVVAQELYAVQDLYSLETVKHLGKEKRAGLIGCSCMKDGVEFNKFNVS